MRNAKGAVYDFEAAEVRTIGTPLGVQAESRVVGPNGSIRLLQPLLRGPISLLSGTNDQGEKRFFLQQQDSAYVIEVLSCAPRLAYLRVMPGCPELDFSSILIETKYTYNYPSLMQLVTRYNKCRYPQQTIQPVADPGGIHSYVGVKAGLRNTSIMPDVTGNAPRTSNSLDWHAGVFVNALLTRHIALQVEAVYSAVADTYGNQEVYNGGAYYKTVMSYNVAYKQVQLPILLRYQFGSGKVRPFLNIGPQYTQLFGRKLERIVQDQNGTPARVSSFNMRGYNVGAASGVGVLWQQPNRPQYSLELRLDHNLRDDKPSAIAPYLADIRLDLGIAF
ncbi:PorT family protein [Hymenobacter sp. BT728]|nr:PorT family protein [Hymenobacter pini]